MGCALIIRNVYEDIIVRNAHNNTYGGGLSLVGILGVGCIDDGSVLGIQCTGNQDTVTSRDIVLDVSWSNLLEVSMVVAICRRIGLICKPCRLRHSHKEELVSIEDSLFKE